MRTPSRAGEEPASEFDAELAAMLQALARDESTRSTPARVETAVLSAWDAAHRPAGVRPRRWRVVAAAAVLIAAVGGTLLVRRPATGTPQVPLVTEVPATALADRSPLPGTSEPAGTTAHQSPRRSSPIASPARTARRQTAAAPAPPRAPAALVLVGTPLTADERVQLVRMRVDREALAGMGLRPAGNPDTATVDLEVFVGEDGVARAVRLGM